MAQTLVQAPLPAGPPGQPDIEYAPDPDKFLARTQRRRETEKLEQSLPSGFPTKLESDLVWDGKDLAEKYDWNYVLTDADIEEIENALKHFKCISLGFEFTFTPRHADHRAAINSTRETSWLRYSRDFPTPEVECNAS